jgi:hypothetical protein
MVVRMGDAFYPVANYWRYRGARHPSHAAHEQRWRSPLPRRPRMLVQSQPARGPMERVDGGAM